MTLTINGEAREIEDGFTLAALLVSHQLRAPLVVVERNGVIVPREKYAQTVLEADDTLEIVQMMAGG